jgi:hypothetical protein
MVGPGAAAGSDTVARRAKPQHGSYGHVVTARSSGTCGPPDAVAWRAASHIGYLLRDEVTRDGSRIPHRRANALGLRRQATISRRIGMEDTLELFGRVSPSAA